MEDLPEARDPAAWKPDELARSETWHHTFTARELAELFAAVREAVGAEAKGKPFLPLLAPEIEKTKYELKSGLGFRVLRGLPVKELGRDGIAPAFMALSRQLGRPMEQPGGVKLAHVRAEPRGKGKGRFGFRTTAELPFHADPEDVIGFLCLRPASEGGTRKLASAATVYNVMREECPHHLQVLTQPFHMVLNSPHPVHGGKWTLLPFLRVKDGLFNAYAYRVHIKRAQRLPGVPELRPAQNEALAAFNDVADRVAVSTDLKPGDIEYFNNHVVLHTRTAFTADDKADRHLLRVWLSMSGFRKLDPEHPISLRARMEAGETRKQGLVRKPPLRGGSVDAPQHTTDHS